MEKLLNAMQVADWLGWHVKTLYRKVRRNEIALNVVRLGSREVAFRPSDVEEFVRARVVVRTGSGRPQAKKKKVER
jgi:predicted DNA-binding transcriptional regulator AlpA